MQKFCIAKKRRIVYNYCEQGNFVPFAEKFFFMRRDFVLPPKKEVLRSDDEKTKLVQSCVHGFGDADGSFGLRSWRIRK